MFGRRSEKKAVSFRWVALWAPAAYLESLVSDWSSFSAEVVSSGRFVRTLEYFLVAVRWEFGPEIENVSRTVHTPSKGTHPFEGPYLTNCRVPQNRNSIGLES